MIIIKIIEVDDLDFFPKLLLLLQFKEKYLIMCERIIIDGSSGYYWKKSIRIH